MPNLPYKRRPQMKAISAFKIWQSALISVEPAQSRQRRHTEKNYSNRAAASPHSIWRRRSVQGGTFAANLTVSVRRINTTYLCVAGSTMRANALVLTARLEKKDTRPEIKKRRAFLRWTWSTASARMTATTRSPETCTVMPSLRLYPEDAQRRLISYLIT